MGYCVNFELYQINGTTAIYKYGECMKDLDGLLELDIPTLLAGNLPTNKNVFTLLPSPTMKEDFAIRAFMKIHNHYKEHNEYPLKGGFYS